MLNFRNCNIVCLTLLLGEEEEDDPDFDPSKVKGGDNPQECKQQ